LSSAVTAGIDFAWLGEHPDRVPDLAALHHAQWRRLLPHWTLGEAMHELATHPPRAAIPTTLVAFVDGELAGSVSLLANDDERIRSHSPWLASLLVLPQHRGRGLGAELVRRCVDIAAQLGIDDLFLYTDDAVAFYERLGWRVVADADLGGTTVQVMSIATRMAQGQAA
jgi:N-acetylglutamate synthase-like GNAT family acetyltransferase